MAEVDTPGEAQQRQDVAQDVEEFASILKQSFKPRTERAEAEVESAISTFVREALDDKEVIKDEAIDTITAMIASIDAKMTAQINEILHAREFQELESAWRGLHHLVFNSETDATLKLRFFNAAKNELYRHLKKYPDANWDQSPLFKSVYEEEYGQLGDSLMAVSSATIISASCRPMCNC